jgi:signal transduction histidine kinase
MNVGQLAKSRLEFIQNVYPKINFVYQEREELIKFSNSDLLIRILDNLLSNVGKYNKIGGDVNLIVEDNKITITDTGKGIKDVSKVLERYYTEQKRGLGIGLHIVNKLTNELGIEMQVKSTIDIGTKIVLDFRNIKED